MNTPREILLRKHHAASPKLDAIRAEVVACLAAPVEPETISWRERILSLRWHFAAMSGAWVMVMVLNTDHSASPVGAVAHETASERRQVWASLRENRRLLMQYTDSPAVEAPAVPGRRSEIQSEQVVV